ncbi:hypothetical protein [Burkholderia ubonensis]|uniref:hypothetical protein n=1 Tax=Burkholderia ubonensis TaxID=101571 RepID=UPI000757D5C3|nr:hypothetical protein [Burkholderia ubonensis]KVP59524.1 hypothetical protein WJ90_02480 [Burkholderia ubonensis]KVR42575.1 hypothetical protein WK16_01605 [Burkholderia ubonensis]
MNQEAELLSTVVQCWLVEQAGHGCDLSDAADIERLMARFRQSAGMLIDHYLEGRNRAQAQQAYDAGIAAGFYGPGSAIGWRGADGRARGDGACAALHGLRQRMYEQGYARGTAFRLLIRIAND